MLKTAIWEVVGRHKTGAQWAIRCAAAEPITTTIVENRPLPELQLVMADDAYAFSLRRNQMGP